MLTAWTFPGQGSQSPGMGRQLLAESSWAREVLKQAEELSGLPLNRIRSVGPYSELRRPEVLEPLLTAIAIGYVDLLRSEGLNPDYLAGYSAGEVAAYYAAGIYGTETALAIAIERGRCFAPFTTEQARMITVAGVPFHSIREHVEAWIYQDVHIAAHNGPTHATLVGEAHGILQAESFFRSLGAQVSPVDVAGKWHTPHLIEATQLLLTKFQTLHLRAPRIPVFSSASGTLRSDPNELIVDLCRGVSQPVRWHPILEQLFESQVTRFVECGSGRVLYGLMRHSSLTPEKYDSICVEDRNGGLRPLKKLVRSA